MTLASEWYSSSPAMLFLMMTICMEPREVKSSWATLAIPIGVSASSRGGGPDLTASSLSNPSGGGGICLHAFRGTATIMPGSVASSGSEATSSHSGICRAVAHSSCSSRSFPSNMASSIGVGEATGSFPQPPAWRHPTGQPSPSGFQGICRGPGLHCRVCQGNPPTVQHIIAGPSPVPPSGLFLPCRCPWGPWVWKVRKGGNLGVLSWPG